ncbi:PREDICTED: uncharacterized protein LOC106742914 [Dinoponera quadriceps]|uniref:Uncharacterized protein LOC106742914 n=1 Tax=Dinoponera quadriceps TaxID=609295 RepID=A0A6P3X0C4_DINQU|nr:PREDICTED: uncharacterized protein LOC106742914 [Dinoponera quadriceps]
MARAKLSATEKFVDGVESGASAGGEEAGSFNYAVAVNRWSMRLLGLWPLDARLSYLKCSVILGLMIVVMLPVVTCLFMITDWVAIMNQVNMTLPSLPMFVRFLVMKIKAQNLRVVLSSMSHDWANYRHLSVRNRRTMFHYAKRGRRINVVCIVWMILTIAVYVITPFGNTWLNSYPGNATGRRLPVDAYFPFSLEQPYVYEMIYVVQSITGVIGGMVIFSVDCFVCVIVFHACGQLEVLAATLERHYDAVEHDRKDARSHTCACLSCIVKRHVHIINYMDVVEKSFNNFILCQLLATTVILAFQGFQIVLVAGIMLISIQQG